MFTGIMIALLAAAIIAALIITLNVIFEAFEKIKNENGRTAVATEAQDLISKAMNDAITENDKISLSQLRKKAGTKGKVIAPVKDGKVVKEKLTIISSNKQDEETQELMDKNNGVLLVDLVN